LLLLLEANPLFEFNKGALFGICRFPVGLAEFALMFEDLIGSLLIKLDSL
jgi:hypothetical protein